MAPPPPTPTDGPPSAKGASNRPARRPVEEPEPEPAPAETPARPPRVRATSAPEPAASDPETEAPPPAPRRAAPPPLPTEPEPEEYADYDQEEEAPPAPVATPTHTAAAAPAREAPPAAAPAASAAGNYSPMLRDKRIGIIGAGAMGSALCRGIVHANAAPANRILVSDPHTAHVENLQKTLGVRVAESNVQVAKYTDIIVLAVKPNIVASVLDEIRDVLKRDAGKPLPLIISIAAGVHLSKLEAHLHDPLPVVRAMPNTPAQVGKGACAYCRGTHADDAHTAQAAEIFNSVGIAVEVPEAWMDAVTALSGSGPAYVYLMIEALVDGGVKAGLPREIAHQLASQTVLGAAQMVIETGRHPAELRDMVTTPAGTTIVALAALEHSGVRAALIDAVERATIRSRELG